MRVQLVINPHDESRSWTLLDDDLSVVEPVEAFLAHFTAIGRSPNTIRAYALDLQDFFTYLNCSDLRWDHLQLEEVGRFIPWLGLTDEARTGGASTLAPALNSMRRHDGQSQASGSLVVLSLPRQTRCRTVGIDDCLTAPGPPHRTLGAVPRTFGQSLRPQACAGVEDTSSPAACSHGG
jgi:hypothetical protein